MGPSLTPLPSVLTANREQTYKAAEIFMSPTMGPGSAFYYAAHLRLYYSTSAFLGFSRKLISLAWLQTLLWFTDSGYWSSMRSRPGANGMGDDVFVFWLVRVGGVCARNVRYRWKHKVFGVRCLTVRYSLLKEVVDCLIWQKCVQIEICRRIFWGDILLV